jgi:hypothetical protein
MGPVVHLVQLTIILILLVNIVWRLQPAVVMVPVTPMVTVSVILDTLELTAHHVLRIITLTLHANTVNVRVLVEAMDIARMAGIALAALAIMESIVHLVQQTITLILLVNIV